MGTKLEGQPIKYRGVAGAAAYGSLIFIVLLAAGVGGAGFIWLKTRMIGPALPLVTRTAFLGLVIGGTAAFCRWLCGGESQRLLTLRMVRGDFGGLGLLLGFVLAGYLTQQFGIGAGTDTSLLATGQPVEITGPTLSGEHFNLADFRGKLVLVDFWATWCGPCVAELPNVRAAYDTHHAQGLEVVSVSFDFDRAALERFLKSNPMPWPQIFFEMKEASGFENPLGRRYGIHAIPCLILVDREGNVAARDLRGSQIQRAVARALGQTGSGQDRFAEISTHLFEWLFVGLMISKWLLFLLCAFGGAVVVALLEMGVRRKWSKPQHAQPAS